MDCCQSCGCLDYCLTVYDQGNSFLGKGKVYNNNSQSSIYKESALVISNSLISKYRLSRSEILVPV